MRSRKRFFASHFIKSSFGYSASASTDCRSCNFISIEINKQVVGKSYSAKTKARYCFANLLPSAKGRGVRRLASELKSYVNGIRMTGAEDVICLCGNLPVRQHSARKQNDGQRPIALLLWNAFLYSKFAQGLLMCAKHASTWKEQRAPQSICLACFLHFSAANLPPLCRWLELRWKKGKTQTVNQSNINTSESSVVMGWCGVYRWMWQVIKEMRLKGNWTKNDHTNEGVINCLHSSVIFRLQYSSLSLSTWKRWESWY